MNLKSESYEELVEEVKAIPIRERIKILSSYVSSMKKDMENKSKDYEYIDISFLEEEHKNYLKSFVKDAAEFIRLTQEKKEKEMFFVAEITVNQVQKELMDTMYSGKKPEYYDCLEEFYYAFTNFFSLTHTDNEISSFTDDVKSSLIYEFNKSNINKDSISSVIDSSLDNLIKGNFKKENEVN